MCLQHDLSPWLCLPATQLRVKKKEKKNQHPNTVSAASNNVTYMYRYNMYIAHAGWLEMIIKEHF